MAKNFQVGDLLVCIDNTVLAALWVGEKPKVGNYYTWSGYISHSHYDDLGAVDEIPLQRHPDGTLCAHTDQWYEKVNVEVNVEELVEEAQFETAY